MSGTGRLVGQLRPRTRRMVYGDLGPAEIAAELPLMIRVDQAHVVMLAAQGLISGDAAGALLREMARLSSDGYAALFGRPVPRGLYLMYEAYLVDALGAEIGGVLHTGRSRNDLKATISGLGLREWLLDFAEQAVRLEAVLLSRARAYSSVVMPVYTHFQAAMPITYGYYLLGVALALGREIEALRAAAAGLEVCPLGAGAVAGTALPIDPARTARLLGYSTPTGHALDAVASRDVPLRLLGAVAGLTILLSRLATDLQLWSTAEFGLIAFPDRLVGGSSAMPQKRNAFLLEHLKAKPAHVSGAWIAAAGAMAATPFTNTIEVGTEAMAAIWPGLAAAEQAVLLGQAVVSGARPVPDRMADRVEGGFTTATAVADQLVRQGVAFRTAHRMVGDAVRRAVEAGSTKLAEFGPPGWLDGLGVDAALDAAEVVGTQVHGGGPGAFAEPHAAAVAAWAGHRAWLAAWRASIAGAQADLAAEVGRLTGGDP